LLKNEPLWPPDGCDLPDDQLVEKRAVGSLNAVGQTTIEPEMLRRFSTPHFTY